MDYKLRQCKIDYFGVRDYLRSGGEFDELEYLGGSESDIYNNFLISDNAMNYSAMPKNPFKNKRRTVWR